MDKGLKDEILDFLDKVCNGIFVCKNCGNTISGSDIRIEQFEYTNGKYPEFRCALCPNSIMDMIEHPLDEPYDS